MDFGRKPYKAKCRFLRDSDLVSTVRWRECRPGAPELDGMSIIYRREWDNDPFREVPVGELPNQRKPFLPGNVPKGFRYLHVCGTPEEFEQGGTLNEELPPVDYDANGFPKCCTGPFLVRGGGGASGRADYTLRRALRRYGGPAGSGRSTVTVTAGRRSYGGAGASGRSTFTRLPAIRSYGGAGAGGRSPFLVVGDCWTRGISCALAEPKTLGRACGIEFGTHAPSWQSWDVTPGDTYELEVWGFPGGSLSFTWYDGDNCAMLTEIVTDTAGAVPVIYVHVAVSPKLLLLVPAGGAPSGAYRVRLVP